MSHEPQLFRINPDSQESARIEEVDFAQLGLRERRDIQEWVAANPGILGEDLLIISKEFSGFDLTNERPDLLAVDSSGKLVVIELKRDDSGSDAHWQAIKYASYLRRATDEQIVDMLAEHKGVSQEDARNLLMQHLGADDDLNALNNDQRIILASHRFAPEVTSAALWLNNKAPGEDLITCVTLTPYQDSDADSLYIQSTTIIPVPGEEGYVVNIGSSSQLQASGSSLGDKLRRTIRRNQNDEITRFLRKVGELTLQGLEGEIRPNRTSRWAGQIWVGDKIWRYYHFWYQRNPWGNWNVEYAVNLWREDEENGWGAKVEFMHYLKGLQEKLTDVSVDPEQYPNPSGTRNGIAVTVRSDALDNDFANRLAEVLRRFIEKITPIVEAFEEEKNEEET